MLDDHRRKAVAAVGYLSHRASLPMVSPPSYPVILTKPARGMFQPGMEAKRPWRWKMQAARDEIGLDQRAACRRRGVPDGERSLAALGLVEFPLTIGSDTRHEA